MYVLFIIINWRGVAVLSAELDRQVVRHGPPHQEGRGAAQDRRQTGTLLQTLAVPARHLSHPQADQGGRRHSFITLTFFVVCLLLLFGGWLGGCSDTQKP